MDGGSQDDSKKTALRMDGVVLADAFLGKGSSDSRNHICSVHPVVVRDILVPEAHGICSQLSCWYIISSEERKKGSWASVMILPLFH